MLAAEQQCLAVASITAHARPFDDAVRACRWLVARGVPLAVASSSARVRLDATLRRISLETFFPVSIAGDEVERGKPDPQILLVAAARLEVRPTDCVVIEDAAPGVQAAQRAGMGCVVVRRDHNRASVERFGADVVCDDLDGLDRLLLDDAPLPTAEQQAPTHPAPQPAPEGRQAPADPPAHRTPSHPVPRASR